MSMTYATLTFNDATPDEIPESDVGQRTYSWLVAWAVMLVLLGLWNRTRTGHTIIYYALWLMLIFLLVTQYRFIAQVLRPLGAPIPSSGG